MYKTGEHVVKKATPIEVRRQNARMARARQMYDAKVPRKQIAKQLGIAQSTLHNWLNRAAVPEKEAEHSFTLCIDPGFLGRTLHEINAHFAAIDQKLRTLRKIVADARGEQR